MCQNLGGAVSYFPTFLVLVPFLMEVQFADDPKPTGNHCPYITPNSLAKTIGGKTKEIAKVSGTSGANVVGLIGKEKMEVPGSSLYLSKIRGEQMGFAI